jgi:hypothetical protein
MSTRLLLFKNYNVASTDYIYGRYSDVLNAPKYLKTSGSSTTVSEKNAGDDVFDGYGVGDLLHVEVDGTWTTRRITSVSGAPDSVTVDTAVDWENGGAGRAFSFQRFSVGTAATDGWFSVTDYASDGRVVQISIETINATSLDFIIEGRIRGNPVSSRLWSESFTAATTITATVALSAIPVSEPVDEIRVGVKITTDGGAQDLTVQFLGTPRVL